MINSLFQHFDMLYELSIACKNRLRGSFKEIKLRQNKRLLKAGSICTDLSFVGSGLLRGYRLHNGKEISCRFTREGDLCIAPQSYLLQIPSEENIRAVTNSLVYSIDPAEAETIWKEFPDFQMLLGIYFAEAYSKAEDWLYMMRTLTPKELYLRTAEQLKKYGKDMKRTFWCSYLGIRPETLSRYRKDTNQEQQ